MDPFADHEVRAEAGTPDDLAGLLDRIRGLDLEVGLALDLERLDPESSIARDHPEWLLEVERDGVVELVLDLSVRSAMGYVWERLTKLLDRHPVSLLRWSPVVGARRPGPAERRHASTLAAYRLLDAAAGALSRDGFVSTALDAAMARRAVVADGVADPGRRHAEFGSLVQVLSPERLWQPAYDEPEDGSAPGYRAVAAFFGAMGMGIDLCRQAPGQPAGDPPLAGVSTRGSGRCCTAARRCGWTSTTRVRGARRGVGDSGTRRCSRWSGWTGRRGGGSGSTGLDPAATYRLEVAGPRIGRRRRR